MSTIDPVCLHHGKRWSEHEHGRCLYCCLCFTTLTPEMCAVTVDGDRVDICVPCYEAEQAALCPVCHRSVSDHAEGCAMTRPCQEGC